MEQTHSRSLRSLRGRCSSGPLEDKQLSIEDLPIVFERYAKEILNQYPKISTKWESPSDRKKRLTIFKKDESGFDVIIEAETYGLYPFAGEWHGAGMGASFERGHSRKFMRRVYGFHSVLAL